MSNRPDSRFTIANVMILVASCAMVLAMIITPGFGSVLVSYLILVAMVVGTVFLVVRRCLELRYGIPCPACGIRGLERRSLISFGERYFFCPSCGLRCRRSLFGVLGFFVWKDASGQEFDAFYQRPTEEDPWNAPPSLDDEDAIYSKTHLNLVLNKRRRKPENPNGPGLE